MRVEELFEALLEKFDHNSYYKTFDGRLKKLYDKARERSKTKGYKELLTLGEFSRWASKDRGYKKVFKEWEDSGYEYGMTPTLDRINVKKGYTLGNLQILTFRENVIKGNKEGKQKRPWEARKLKVILRHPTKTEKEFNSKTDAARWLSVSPSAVTNAMNRTRPIKGWTIELVTKE